MKMKIRKENNKKLSLLLEILTYHNSKINWKIGEVKMMRYPEKCKKQ